MAQASGRRYRMENGSAAGGSASYGDYIQAMNYYINTLMNKKPTQRQQEAVDRLNASDVKKAKADARERVRVSESKSSSSSRVPVPEPRPTRARELTDSGRVRPAPYVRSVREIEELASNAAERRYGSGPDSKKPSTVDTKSKKPIAKRIMEALGDTRTMDQATQDRIDNKKAEREMMGRKKGGMGQKKKAPVKKAYGGMVKKKQGGSANKVNMKAGFTRRGCSKG